MAAAGARFEGYVREAMKEQDIASLAELSRRSGIALSAWHGWFRGEREPRRNSLVLAGAALSRTPEQLGAVWEGTKPHKALERPQTAPELVSAVEAQTRVLESIAAKLDALLDVTRQTEEAEATRALGAAQERLGIPSSRRRRRHDDT